MKKFFFPLTPSTVALLYENGKRYICAWQPRENYIITLLPSLPSCTSHISLDISFGFFFCILPFLHPCVFVVRCPKKRFSYDKFFYAYLSMPHHTTPLSLFSCNEMVSSTLCEIKYPSFLEMNKNFVYR